MLQLPNALANQSFSKRESKKKSKQKGMQKGIQKGIQKRNGKDGGKQSWMTLLCNIHSTYLWGWPNTLLDVSPRCLKERSKELSRTRKIHLFNRITTLTIRQHVQSDNKSVEGPRGVVRPKFKVNVDCSTCGYWLRVEASSFGVFIGNPARRGIHEIAGVCSHQRGRHKWTNVHIKLEKKIQFIKVDNSNWRIPKLECR